MIEVRWTQEEIERLNNVYPHYSNADLSKMFGRSISSIQHKAKRRKL